MGKHINPELPTAVHDSLRDRADDYGMTWGRYLSAVAGWHDGAGGPPDDVMLAAMRADDHADAYDAAREAATADDDGAATDGGRPTVADAGGGSRPDGDPDAPTDGDAPEWAVGLSEPERAVVEHLVGVLDGHNGALDTATLDAQIPLEHVEVEVSDVTGALRAHPAVADVGSGAFAVE